MQKGEQIDPFLGRSIEGDQGSADFHRGHVRSRINSENSPERSLRRLGGVCLEHTGQGDPSKLGGNVGCSSLRRDQKAEQGRKQRQGDQNKGGGGGGCCPRHLRESRRNRRRRTSPRSNASTVESWVIMRPNVQGRRARERPSRPRLR